MANDKHAFGWVPDLPDNRDLTYSVYRPVPLPASVDLRPQMPPVYDQGQLGSCTANAIAAAFDFDRHSQGKAFMSPSRLFIYYNERAVEHTIGSDAGAQIRDGIKVINKLGVTAEKNWPYDIDQFTKKPTIAAFKDALKNQATAYARVSRSVTSIKQALAQGHPVVIGFTVYESFESQDVADSGVMPMPARGEKVLGGHAVLVVGYDADGWIVRNSWGDGWGKHGYFSMPEPYLTERGLSSDFWVVTGVEI